jgi:predicted DCC family thiol-disulfide oxidoreductase YuxK
MNTDNQLPAGFSPELIKSDGVILFDGHCAFCRNVVGQLLRHCTSADLRVCSTRSRRGDAAARNIGGDPAYTFAFVTRTDVYLGVDAYVRILSFAPLLAWPSKLLTLTPRVLSENVYQWVATHRPFMSRLLGRGSRDAIPLERFVEGGN